LIQNNFQEALINNESMDLTSDNTPFEDYEKRIYPLIDTFRIGKKKTLLMNSLRLGKRTALSDALRLGKKAVLTDSLRLGKRWPRVLEEDPIPKCFDRGSESDDYGNCPNSFSSKTFRLDDYKDDLENREEGPKIDSMKFGKRTLHDWARETGQGKLISRIGKKAATFKDSLRLGKKNHNHETVTQIDDISRQVTLDLGMRQKTK